MVVEAVVMVLMEVHGAAVEVVGALMVVGMEVEVEVMVSMVMVVIMVVAVVLMGVVVDLVQVRCMAEVDGEAIQDWVPMVL